MDMSKYNYHLTGQNSDFAVLGDTSSLSKALFSASSTLAAFPWWVLEVPVQETCHIACEKHWKELEIALCVVEWII